MHMICLIHKDIKPANILYSPSRNELVLCDFGISDFVADKIGWKSLTFKEGTKHYMC
jgi:serine/threonine protein kinase